MRKKWRILSKLINIFSKSKLSLAEIRRRKFKSIDNGNNMLKSTKLPMDHMFFHRPLFLTCKEKTIYE